MSDLTFITNQSDSTLLDRFNILIRSNTKYFDCLVGYFYTSGFYKIYKALEKTEKIRILIGISTDLATFQLMEEAKRLSHFETKEMFGSLIENEMEDSEDSYNVEEGVRKFIEWLKNGESNDPNKKPKLYISAYPSRHLHAKLYIMTFGEGDRDVGRVITGSSNFTQSGLVDNLEFNVELKNRADYEFAIQKFDELWKDAVDLSEKYIQTINEKTHLKETITPYEIYLKTLYEYFKEELNQSEEMFLKYIPENFKNLEYQREAVLNAKRILEEYGGVFISDVVGLGKTYIGAMLASQLDGRNLVIAPPALLDKTNPGSWPNVFLEFKIAADYQSIGKLDEILKNGLEKYKNIIIDEAHRFRVETNVTYEKLAEICRGKRVILVTATPYNNTPKDILSLIKLFQSSRKSSIPNLQDIEGFINSLDQKLNDIDRQKNYEEYIKVVKENAKEIREKILKYLMVRRTRSEIVKYFSKDLEKQKLKFPEPEDPIPLYYELNEEEDNVFNKTIEHLTESISYSRYMPLLYLKKKISQPEQISQKNMGKIMKVLLVKRLESSFYAFKNSIERFIYSYEMFIKEFEKGNVYISKKYTNKIFELLEENDEEEIQKLIDEGKAEKYLSKDFEDNFIIDLKNDLKILKEIKALWSSINRDPKLNKLLESISQNEIINKNKVILFTESKETAEYLTENVNEKFGKIALLFTGSSSENIRDKVIENFDAKVKNKKDHYRILICTDVLSEGVNLHRSNVVINYDIPWNPTRMMQRVGRINRVDTSFDKIYTFNFFPTKQANDEIQLREIAESKINAFLTLLGGDAALLTEGEPIGSHELFNRLISKEIFTEEVEEESELKYLEVIKKIRDENPELFEKIKHLPKKAKSAKKNTEYKNALLTYFRKGKLDKFYIVKMDSKPIELDFISSAKLLEAKSNEKREKIPTTYYELLAKNKDAFTEATTEELVEVSGPIGKDRAKNILKMLKALPNTKTLTDEQELYLKKVMEQLSEGGLPKQTTKETLSALEELSLQDLKNPLKVIGVLKTNIPERLLEKHYTSNSSTSSNKREVILSVYFSNDE